MKLSSTFKGIAFVLALSIPVTVFSQIFESTIGAPVLPGQFKSPTGIAIDPAGNVFVSDENTNMISKFDANGNFLLQWGGFGTVAGKLSNPRAIATDNAGNVYVSEGGNARVQKFDGNGTPKLSFGSYGKTDGLLDYPGGIAVDGAGNIYVSDYNNNRIQVFDNLGVFKSKFGSSGSGTGQFFRPDGIAIDKNGNIYVADRGNKRVQKFNSAGAYISQFGSFGFGDSFFNEPNGIAFDQSGNIFVTDTYNCRVQKFSPGFGFLTAFGSYGAGDGQFRNVNSIAIDGTGNLYLADYGENARVQKFNSAGVFLTGWGRPDGAGQIINPNGTASDSDGNIFIVDTGNNRIQKFNSLGTTVLLQWGTYGTGDGQFNSPRSIYIDKNDNVYVVDSSYPRIQIFNKNGGFISKFGTYGSASGQFNSPEAIAVDVDGNIYVADTGNNRIQKFNSSAAFQFSFGTPGSGNGEFVRPNGIAVDAAGFVYVVDQFYRVQKFDASGAFVSKWGSQGSSQGFVNDLHDISVNALGQILVCDYNVVYIFDNNGTLLNTWKSWSNPNDTFSYTVSAVSSGPDNSIYVSDGRNNRVVKFSYFSVSGYAVPSAAIGTSVDINGSGFSTTASDHIVKFNGVIANTPTQSTPSKITVAVPALATTGPVTVTRSGNTVSSAKDFIVQPFVITSVSPEIGPAGTAVTITGSGFSAVKTNNLVKFNGISTTPTLSSYNSLTVNVPAGNTVGKITVTISGQTVQSPNDFIGPLAITSLSVPKGAAGASVSINGTGFSNATTDMTVKFKGATAEIVASESTRIDVKVPPAATTGTITVSRSGVTVESSTEFVVLPLAITTFAPEFGAANALITITGTGFSSIAANNIVKFNGLVANVESPSEPTSLKVRVPAGSAAGKITIAVGPESAISANDFGEALTITSFTPTNAAINSIVTITGTGFSTNASNQIVKFNNVVTTLTPISTTSLSAVVPAGATTGAITVERQGTIVQSPKEFIVAPFKIKSFSPTTAAVNTNVTIIGSGFSSIKEKTSVSINNQLATVVSSDSEKMVVTVLAGTTTGKIKITIEGETTSSDEDLHITNLAITGSSFPPDFIVGNSSVNAIVNVNDATEIQSIKFLSKGISNKETTYTSEDVSVPTAGNTITFPIPSARFNDPIGLHYSFSLTDKKGNTGIDSDEGYTYLNYPDGSKGADIPNLIFGKGSESYQLISFPFNLTVPYALTVFEDLGPFKKNKWRLFAFNSPAHEELDGRARIELGKGYWLIARDKTDINAGGGKTPNVTEKNPYVLSLKSGWNLIGNPYNFTISWNDVLAANNNPTGVGKLKLYKAGFVQGDALKPFVGAFVRLDGADKIDLKIPVVNKGVTGRSGSFDEFNNQSIASTDWQLKLTLDDGLIHDELAGIGMNKQAKEGKDLFDEVTLPVPDGLATFELTMKELSNMKLLKDIVPTQEEYTWTGQLWNEHDITIGWDNSYFGDNDKQLVFETEDRVELTDMRKTSGIKLSSGQHLIKIHFGTNEYIKKATLDKEIRVGDVFPNPLRKGETLKVNISLPVGSSDIKVEVRELNGKNTVASGEGKYDEGRKIIEWVPDFSSLSSGLYLVRISVSHAHGVATHYKKLVVENSK